MKTNSATYVLTFMLVTCLLFGLGVSVVHYATQNMLKNNEKLQLYRVLSKAFLLEPKEKTIAGYEKIINAEIKSQTISYQGREWQVYTRNTSDKCYIGFEFRGVGFWDEIKGILVLKEDLDSLLHIAILSQKETPGLGARIEEQWFTDQFKELTVDWNNNNGSLIIIGASSNANATNKVDAITGATQTSMALMNMINQELKDFKSLLKDTGHEQMCIGEE